MDITNTCNLDCIGCALGDTRKALHEPAAAMKVDLFEKIANQVFPYLSEIALSCEAEPILHPQFVRIMQIIRDKTERGTNLPIRMTTNATLLSKERLDAIFEAGLFGLTISIDGFAPETFSKIRKRGEISTVLGALDEIVRRKSALGRTRTDVPHLQINYTLMKSTLHELIPLIEYSRRWQLDNFTVVHVYSTETKDMRHESLADWQEESDRVLIEAERKCREYGIIPRFPGLFRSAARVQEVPSLWERIVSRLRPNAVQSSPSPMGEPQLACSAPWSMLKIRWDGSVHPCDLWNFRMPMGSLQTQSFEEIWKCEKYIELRSGLFCGRPTFAHCLKCDRISQDNLEKRKLRSVLAHTSVTQ